MKKTDLINNIGNLVIVSVDFDTNLIVGESVLIEIPKLNPCERESFSHMVNDYDLLINDLHDKEFKITEIIKTLIIPITKESSYLQIDIYGDLL